MELCRFRCGTLVCGCLRLSKLRAHQAAFTPMGTKVGTATPESRRHADSASADSRVRTTPIDAKLPRTPHFVAFPCWYWAYSFHSLALSTGSVSWSAALRKRRATR